jgi:hypothetical protein
MKICIDHALADQFGVTGQRGQHPLDDRLGDVQGGNEQAVATDKA